MLAEAYAATRRGGTTVTVGLPDPSRMLSIPAVSLVAEERTLRGSYLGSSRPRARHPASSSPSTARAACPSTGCSPTGSALDDLNEGFDRLARGEGVRQAVVL